MKKAFFALVLGIVTLLSVSCSKDLDLNGTTWNAKFTETITMTMEGIPITVDPNMDFVLAFTDATNGTMTTSGTMTAMGQTFPMETSTSPLTYTFDGTNGTMTSEGETIPFTYNKDTKILNINMKDEETGIEMNLNFTQAK